MSKSKSEILLKKDTSSYASKLNQYQICHRSRSYLPLGKRNWQEIISKMMKNIFNFLTVLSHRVFSASFHVGIFILNSIWAPFDYFCKMLFYNTFLGFSIFWIYHLLSFNYSNINFKSPNNKQYQQKTTNLPTIELSQTYLNENPKWPTPKRNFQNKEWFLKWPKNVKIW